VKYFVSPPGPTDWRLDPDQFRDAVVRRWPGAQVRDVTDAQRTAALDVRLDVDGKPVDGTLSRDGLAVALDAGVRSSARFARWLRSIAPDSQPLVFYDEGCSADVPPTSDTTEEELARPFLVH
jgi:hypothetical protein